MLRDKISLLVSYHNRLLVELYDAKPHDIEDVISEVMSYKHLYDSYCSDTQGLVYDWVKEKKPLLFEGARRMNSVLLEAFVVLHQSSRKWSAAGSCSEVRRRPRGQRSGRDPRNPLASTGRVRRGKHLWLCSLELPLRKTKGFSNV